MAITARHSLLAARPSAAVTYIFLCFVVTVTVFVSLLVLDDTQQRALLQEGGVLETMSALLYLVAIALLLPFHKTLWPFILVLAVFCAREFDLDKLLFTEGLFKSRQYIGNSVPLGEKLISGCILLAICVASALTVLRGARGFLRRLIQGDGVAICVLLGIFLAGTSKITDGLGRKLASFDIIISEWTELAALTYEEVAEFGMALSFTVAAFAFTRLYAATTARSRLEEAPG